MQSWFYILLLFIACSCGNTSKVNPSPPGYDFYRPGLVNLPGELDEISGLSYYAKDTSLFAISDEKGVLFKIHTGIPTRISKWKVSPKADFEDIVLLDSIFYLLKANGVIQLVKFVGKDSIYNQEFPSAISGENDFETLYYDPSIKRLVALCKECEVDKKGVVSAILFDPQTFNENIINIDVSALTKKDEKKSFHLKAAAAAIHPITGELYILSSVNRLLVVMNKNKEILASYPLDPGLFKQPEGLCFSDDGMMMISNEAADVGTANILFFRYKKT